MATVEYISAVLHVQLHSVRWQEECCLHSLTCHRYASQKIKECDYTTDIVWQLLVKPAAASPVLAHYETWRTGGVESNYLRAKSTRCWNARQLQRKEIVEAGSFFPQFAALLAVSCQNVRALISSRLLVTVLAEGELKSKLVLNITANSYGTESEVIHLRTWLSKLFFAFFKPFFLASVTRRLSTSEPCETSRLVVRMINLGSRNYDGGKGRRAEVSWVGSKQQKTAFIFKIEWAADLEASYHTRSSACLGSVFIKDYLLISLTRQTC